MKSSDVFPSKFLAKEDVPNPLIATVHSVRVDNVGGRGKPNEQKPILHFTDDQLKPMVLNRTNWKALAGAYGEDSDHWQGRKVQIYVNPDVTDLSGNVVGGLRLRIPQAGGGFAANGWAGAFWTFEQAIEEAGKAFITRDQIVAEIRKLGGNGWDGQRDTAVVKAMIAAAQRPAGVPPGTPIADNEEIPF